LWIQKILPGMSRIVLKVSVHEKVIFPHHHMADDEQQRLQQNVSTSYDPLRTILSRLLSPFGAVPSAPTAPQSLQTQNTPYYGNNTPFR
jgi:hypothetical protein